LTNVENESKFNCYLGLLTETFMSLYELDVYGYITVTSYKILIIKNETKTSNLGGKPNDTPIKELF